MRSAFPIVQFPFGGVGEWCPPPATHVWVVEEWLHDGFTNAPDGFDVDGARAAIHAHSMRVEGVVGVWVCPVLHRSGHESSHAPCRFEGEAPQRRCTLRFSGTRIKLEEIAVRDEQPHALPQVTIVLVEPKHDEVRVGPRVWFKHVTYAADVQARDEGFHVRDAFTALSVVLDQCELPYVGRTRASPSSGRGCWGVGRGGRGWGGQGACCVWGGVFGICTGWLGGGGAGCRGEVAVGKERPFVFPPPLEHIGQVGWHLVFD